MFRFRTFNHNLRINFVFFFFDISCKKDILYTSKTETHREKMKIRNMFLASMVEVPPVVSYIKCRMKKENEKKGKIHKNVEFQ